MNDEEIRSNPFRLKLLSVLTEQYKPINVIVSESNVDRHPASWQIAVLEGCDCVDKEYRFVNGKIFEVYAITPKGRRVVNG